MSEGTATGGRRIVTEGRAWLVVVLGWLVTAWAGLRGGSYRPNPFDADDPLPCSFSGDGCPSPAELESILRTQWWAVAAGAVVLVVGLALTVRAASPETRPPARGPLSPVSHALLAGLAGALCLAVLLVPAVAVSFAGPHAVPAAVGALWVGQAAVLRWVDSVCGPVHRSPRRAWLTGLAGSALGLGAAVAALAMDGGPVESLWPYGLVDAAVVAVVVLLVRLLSAPRHGAEIPALPRRAT